MTALVASLGLSANAVAQTKKSKKPPEEQAQKDTGAIQRAYAAGAKAYEAGDMAGAEQQLSVALAGGGLPNAQMARALYLRGAAYRKLGRPAQAISDLTTAVWLKGGLSEADKAKATEERQLAYREAGLGEQAPPIGAAPLDQSTKTASPAPAPATTASGTQIVQVTKQSWWSGVPSISMPSLSMPSFTGSASEPAPAATQTADSSGSQGGFWSFLSPSPSGEGQNATLVAGMAPDAAGGTPVAGTQVESVGTAFVAEAPPPTSSWSTETAHGAVATGDAYSPSAAAAAAPDAGINPLAVSTSNPAPPAAPVSNPLEGAGTAVSDFFGNMFGSGSTQTAQPAAVTTASTEHAPWNSDTTVVTAQTSSMVQRSPDSPPPAQPHELPWGSQPMAAAPPPPVQLATAAPAAAAGKYKLQVAAVRSRDEAERLAQSLNGFQPVREGSVAPEIDETVIGSMGTFYRVRLGPYANAKEPDQLCAALKPQGFDCMVVTQ